jgi:hypothetical protein
MCVGQRNGPAGARDTPEPGPQRKVGTLPVDINIVRDARPDVPERRDDQDRPCACYSGLVFVGYIDEYGVEREASYPCQRCAGETS